MKNIEKCPVCEQDQDLTKVSKEHVLKMQQLTSIAGVVEQIWHFLANVAEKKAPLMTQICLITPDTGEEIDGAPKIHLWAGYTDTNPIARLFQKNEEIAALKKEIEELRNAVK